MSTNALVVLIIAAGICALVAAVQTKHAMAIIATCLCVVAAVLAWGPA